MTNDDYEIIPHKEIAELKKQVKELKRGDISGSYHSEPDSINKILEIFKEASASLKEEQPIDEKIDSLNIKLDKILDQNQKIAEGVLSVADLISSLEQKVPEKPEPKLNLFANRPAQPMPQPISQSQPAPPAQPLQAPEPPFRHPQQPIPRQIPPGPTPQTRPTSGGTGNPLQQPQQMPQGNLSQKPFPKPTMPSLDPMEDNISQPVGLRDMSPLPQRPNKKRLFR